MKNTEMRRILVIGCPGAGKSTFARKLRDLSGLPLTCLDMLWHKPDKTNYTQEEFDASLENVLEQDRWIIDGNYNRTLERRLERCDTVFFLDYPVDLCLESAASRVGTEREDMPWVETEFDPEFRQFILDFPRDQLPRIRMLLDQYRESRYVTVFKSREEADDWLLRQRFQVLRGAEEFLRAGAYYVRIQAMAKAYHITLPEEVDDTDGPDCHYILALDRDFPAATCRWFETGPGTAEIGRVVVLPEYRGEHLGSLVIREAEAWIAEEGFQKIAVSSRKGVEPFYESLGYVRKPDHDVHSTTFECVYMEKNVSVTGKPMIKDES